MKPLYIAVSKETGEPLQSAERDGSVMYYVYSSKKAAIGIGGKAFVRAVKLIPENPDDLA